MQRAAWGVDDGGGARRGRDVRTVVLLARSRGIELDVSWCLTLCSLMCAFCVGLRSAMVSVGFNALAQLCAPVDRVPALPRAHRAGDVE